ncbi:hypothetical protein [Salegentibacter mishustinae]|uniref:hypothetical protein n=1 Tax=Salegentibacter mishustinae TaxID=270918 RepID=UPI002490A3F5|nr:hypothetical protein [Salegentibacter mishustinae]
MTIEEKIDSGQGVIYHELGHLFAYYLANQNSNTKLGKVQKLEIGFLMNRVVPEDRLYHFEQSEEDRQKVKQNTRNIDRTIAWFIENIAGCTFQTIFEKVKFENCFKGKLGEIDFGNLSAIRKFSAFNWDFHQLYDLQNDLEKLLIQHQIIEKFKPLVNHIKKKLFQSTEQQLTFENEKLEDLTSAFQDIINTNFQSEYLDIISKYKKIMAS